jgi:CRP/FNR family cyclic AMP-dependent transcriptional regulator
MKPDAIAAVLEHVLILRELPSDELAQLSQHLPMESFKAGEAIYKQGATPEALYVLLNGQVELIAHTEGDLRVSEGQRYPGDLVGEVEMVFRQPRLNTAIASDDVRALRWDRSELSKFMKSHSESLADLQFLAQGQRLARKLDFKWLREGESIYILTRKSTFILYQKLSIPILLLLGAIFFTLWTLLTSVGWTTWLAIALGFAGLPSAVWQWIDWSNDYYLVTDWRTVWLEKVVAIYDSRREAPLHTILSVSVNTDMTGRMLSFGDVLIRTYTGKLLFRNVTRPHTVAAMIEENWRRLRARQEQADRAALIDALQNRLETPQAATQPLDESLQVQTESDDGLEPAILRRRYWGFRVRFEEGDVITYRKHWAVLLREIGLPSILLITIIGILGARLGGLITLLSWPLFMLTMFALLTMGSIWWLYRYVDWANDIYQITPDQIIDVYKKPLAREERKVAPIENILGTEVDRKGLIGILLNYGDVIANVGTTQFIFEGVLDPVTVQQDIVHAQEAFLQQKSERDRSRRQSEMVELFDIYHEKYATGERDRPDVQEDEPT